MCAHVFGILLGIHQNCKIASFAKPRPARPQARDFKVWSQLAVSCDTSAAFWVVKQGLVVAKLKVGAFLLSKIMKKIVKKDRHLQECCNQKLQ